MYRIKLYGVMSFFIIVGILTTPLQSKATNDVASNRSILRFGMLETIPNESLSFDHQRLPFFIQPEKLTLDVPLVKQMPELPRGCEVTSLAMLLQYKGIDVTKDRLAHQIKKDPTAYKLKNGHVYFGNPNTGFVGSMTTFNRPGLGVYHGPIADLARKYLGNSVLDLTGKPFKSVIEQLIGQKPVWVVTTSTFQPLAKKYWRTWETPKGKIKITYKEHAVVVTGYDQKWIYYNDPLSGKKNRKAERQSFIKAWEQMGSQAVSFK
ncbi:uncharacterized protein YvpB [Pullulanibacillus pueri]|uniref:Peptidase C39-like domain-containing protein n=1 Tax=Pullulanibacillus pueri TaxID=1437324 RepID=A0A8J2ZVZ7_9BACL|nr:C39 family peptidase [Pullulanibacillus pueri]MBM7682333.1 uncharacterized protein YvpB [Pullulanibacillus pueri]GGH80762.1 hypothetical protein GCM10007096_17650 [Pullulanibacillus pueri]